MKNAIDNYDRGFTEGYDAGYDDALKESEQKLPLAFVMLAAACFVLLGWLAGRFL